MGTEIDRRSAPIDTAVWSARVLENGGEVVREIHEDYVRAGADLQMTNTFATALHVLRSAGLGDRFEDFNRRAVELCHKAIASAAGGREQWIAGSISTYAESSDRSNLPALPELRANFTKQAMLLAEAGVDMIALEMLADVETSCALAEAAAVTGLPFSLGFTLCFADDDKTLVTLGRPPIGGASFEETLAQVLDRLPSGAETMIGVMHSDLDVTDAAAELLGRRIDGPLVIYPNSGIYEMPHWRFDTVCTPDDFVDHALRWINDGAAIVGGCCGLGPEHIAALAHALA